MYGINVEPWYCPCERQKTTRGAKLHEMVLSVEMLCLYIRLKTRAKGQT